MEKKQIFEKKSHSAEKLEGGPLGFFNIHSFAKHQKIEGRIICIFGKKSHSAKKTEGGPFGIFQHPFRRKTGKKLKGGPPLGEIFISEKKVSQCRKKLIGGPFGLARYGMLRGETGKTFLV